MSHFYGIVNGYTQKTEATRRGFKTHGLTTTAASWNGAVKVHLWHDKDRDIDMAEIYLIPWHGNGTSEVIYRGPVNEKINTPEHKTQEIC
jgi:hypothetical protein